MLGARSCRCRRWSRRSSPALAFVSVLVYHDTARWVGGGWMVFGLVSYVVYRKGVEGTTLTKRVEVPAEALTKGQVAGSSTATSSCRSSGRSSTTTSSAPPAGSPTPPSGRRELAAAARGRLRDRAAAHRAARLAAAAGARRARPTRRWSAPSEVGEEYETVEVHPTVVRARKVGAGIVEAARDRGVEAIVIGGRAADQDPRRRRPRRDRRREAGGDRRR